MSARALLIEVRLLDGRYHGTGDWPPAPFRLFQALVAGAYGGRWGAEAAEEKDDAFRWLERLAPPHVAAPAKTEARATTYYVPNNDIDAVEGDPARVAKIRTGKVVRPILFDVERSFLYAWRFEGDDGHARRVCTLAERLHTFGRGIDAAFALAEVVDWDEALARLAASQSAIAKPVGRGGADDLTCPVDGSLDSLKQRHAALAKRFELRRDGRTMLTFFRQPPKPRFCTEAYERSPTRHLFELRSSSDPARFRSVTQERAADVAKAVRDLVSRELCKSLPNREAEIERIIVGRGANPVDAARRVRFVPLPSIGSTHTDPTIRRVLVEIPPDCPIAADAIAWAVSGRSVPGFDCINTETGEVLEETVLSPAGDTTMLAHYGIGGRATRRWHTITPIALPESRPRGRMSGSERADRERQAAVAVAQALRHAGRDWREIDVRVQTEPFHLKGARADAFAPDRFGSRLRHVEIVFSESVRGPLVIGDGRWLGLGLMAPAAPDKQRLPGVHIFAIDPAEAPPVSQRETIVRALRRAVMARVDDVLGGTRGRQGEPLPTFFSGHEADGSPARSGQHEHLFFLADDADGDGRIDRLAVVSPHLADRTPRDAGATKELHRNLRALDRALAELTTLRAGRAGVPHVAHIAESTNRDRIFGRARAWVSRSPYRPARHARAGSVREAMAIDLSEELRRRGFPAAKVEVLDTTSGAGRSPTARLRLRFETAIEGPLLLGRGSHFGSGLFGIDEVER